MSFVIDIISIVLRKRRATVSITHKGENLIIFYRVPFQIEATGSCGSLSGISSTTRSTAPP